MWRVQNYLLCVICGDQCYHRTNAFHSNSDTNKRAVPLMENKINIIDQNLVNKTLLKSFGERKSQYVHINVIWTTKFYT